MKQEFLTLFSEGSRLTCGITELRDIITINHIKKGNSSGIIIAIDVEVIHRMKLNHKNYYSEKKTFSTFNNFFYLISFRELFCVNDRK